MPGREGKLSPSPPHPQLQARGGAARAGARGDAAAGGAPPPAPPRHACRPLDDVALLDDAPSEAGADDRRDRAPLGGEGAEEPVVRVEGGGVAVVVVDDGQGEPLLEGAPEVVAPPPGVG